MRVNLIEAFDAPWKRRFEGTVGGHWGLFDDTNREQKFYWDRPVSDHPYWLWQAGAGLLIGRRRLRIGLSGAKSASLAAKPHLKSGLESPLSRPSAGALLGHHARAGCDGEPGLRWAGAVGGADSHRHRGADGRGGYALVRARSADRLRRTLGRRANWPTDRLTWFTGLVLVAVTLAALHAALGLVFDPRYKRFSVSGTDRRNRAVRDPVL